MIIKFKIFERKDIELADDIKDITNMVVQKLKIVIRDMIDKSYCAGLGYCDKEINNWINFSFCVGNINVVFRFLYHSYDGEKISGNYYPIKNDSDSTEIEIYEPSFNKKIEEINKEKDYKKRISITKTINYDNIEKVLYHELVHNWDDTKNKLRFGNKKDYNLVKNSIKNGENGSELKKKRHTLYFKSVAEYNAYFVAAVNYLKDEIKNKEYVLSDNFNEFRTHFISLLNFKNEFYEKSIFKKKFDKRIYDLYKKLNNDET